MMTISTISSDGRVIVWRPAWQLYPSRPHGPGTFEAHYQRVRSDPENTTRAIDEDGALVGMIASFTLEGDRELTYWSIHRGGAAASPLEPCDSSSRTSLKDRSTRELRSTTSARTGCSNGTAL